MGDGEAGRTLLPWLPIYLNWNALINYNLRRERDRGRRPGGGDRSEETQREEETGEEARGRRGEGDREETGRRRQVGGNMREETGRRRQWEGTQERRQGRRQGGGKRERGHEKGEEEDIVGKIHVLLH